MKLKKVCSTTYKILDYGENWIATINYPTKEQGKWSLICDNLLLGSFTKEEALIAVEQYKNGTFDGDIKDYDYDKKEWIILNKSEIKEKVLNWQKQEQFYKKGK